MTRKEWLETFLHLADNNAIAMEYRRKLGIRAQKLPTFVKRIPGYRKELAALRAEEVQAETQRKRVEALAKARQAAREKRIRERQKNRGQVNVEELESATAPAEELLDGDGSEPCGQVEAGAPECDSEAVGPRDDSGDES